jgi:hypothetical protein
MITENNNVGIETVEIKLLSKKIDTDFIGKQGYYSIRHYDRIRKLF